MVNSFIIDSNSYFQMNFIEFNLHFNLIYFLPYFRFNEIKKVFDQKVIFIIMIIIIIFELNFIPYLSKHYYFHNLNSMLFIF